MLVWLVSAGMSSTSACVYVQYIYTAIYSTDSSSLLLSWGLSCLQFTHLGVVTHKDSLIDQKKKGGEEGTGRAGCCLAVGIL